MKPTQTSHYHILWSAALALLTAGAVWAATPAERFQQGLTKETADGDLTGAIEVYRQIVADEGDAAVAARAQLHIGLCYEKLGRQEATAAYEAVIEQFAAHSEIVAQARERLQSLQRDDAKGVRHVGAGPERTAQLIAELEAKRARVGSGRGTMAVVVEVFGKRMRSEGPIWFAAPDRFRSEIHTSMAGGGLTQTVTDGGTAWTYQPAARMVMRVDAAALRGEFADYSNTSNNVLHPFSGIEAARFVRSDGIDGVEVQVFQGRMATVAGMNSFGALQPDWVEIAVGVDDGLLRRHVAYLEDDGEMARSEITIEALNEDLADSLFVFTPPAGIEPVDMTDAVRALMAGGDDSADRAAAPATPATPTSAQVDAIIESLEAARETVDSYRAESSQKMSMMGRMMETKTKEWVAGDKSSRREMSSDMAPGVTISIIREDTSWNYMPAMRIAQRLDNAQLKAALEEGEEGEEKGKTRTFEGIVRDSIAYAGVETLDGTEVHVFEGPSPSGLKGMGIDLARSQVWVGAADGLVRKQIMYDSDGKEVMVQTRSQVAVNVDIPDSLLTFSPPEGVQVTDMTEATAERVKQMRAGTK